MSEDGQPDESKEWEDYEHSEQDIYLDSEDPFDKVRREFLEKRRRKQK